MPRVRIDPLYERAAQKYPLNLQRRAAKTLAKFCANPRAHGLNFEKLAGFGNYFSIRINDQFRILLRHEQEDLYAAVDMGTHEVYRRRR